MQIEKISDLNFLKSGITPSVCTAKTNKIVDLPENLPQLKNLRILNLAGNQLQKIPIQVCDLNNLKTLHFGGNLIQEIPQEIKHIQRLVILVTQ